MPKVELPVGTQPEPLEFPHFPTLHQAIIWRNWELVSVNRLAQVLKTSEKNVMKSAQDMGLRIPPVVGNTGFRVDILLLLEITGISCLMTSFSHYLDGRQRSWHTLLKRMIFSGINSVL